MVDPPVRCAPRTVSPDRPVRRGRRGRRAVGALAVAACVVSLAACGGGDGPERAGSTGPGAAVPERGATAADADRSSAWPGASDDRAVLARRTVAVRRALDAPTSTRPTADLLIRGLTVRGGIATLRFAAVLHGWDYEEPRSPGGMPPSAPTLYDINPGRNTDQVSATLIDPVNLRQHSPLEDSEGEVLASMNFVGQSADGQAMDASWMFAAPPAGVDAMDVQVGSWPVFREVPVTRR